MCQIGYALQKELYRKVERESDMINNKRVGTCSRIKYLNFLFMFDLEYKYAI